MTDSLPMLWGCCARAASVPPLRPPRINDSAVSLAPLAYDYETIPSNDLAQGALAIAASRCEFESGQEFAQGASPALQKHLRTQLIFAAPRTGSSCHCGS